MAAMKTFFRRSVNTANYKMIMANHECLPSVTATLAIKEGAREGRKVATKEGQLQYFSPLPARLREIGDHYRRRGVLDASTLTNVILN